MLQFFSVCSLVYFFLYFLCWSRKDQLKTLLDEVLLREDERCKKFVQDFLSKYDYYIN